MARGNTRQRPADDRQDPGANGANGAGPVKSEFAPDLGVDGTEVEIAPDQAAEQARHDLAQHEQVVEMGEVCGAAAHDSVAAMTDDDPAETAEWLESLDYVLQSKGRDRVKYLLSMLEERAYRSGVEIPFSATTPYINTIPLEEQPIYPGNREIERRIKSIIRWNAMAMVVRANREDSSVGGHISTFASAATLYEVGFNHFFRGRGQDFSGDQVYFQGHASPGMYARAFVEGRLTETNLLNFRREMREGGGLSSYPHPWLMPEFWEYPTVSMGLGPIMSIYQARFNKYLSDRGVKDTSNQHVWCFLGDGECDEPETLGAIGLAARENLDNLIFVINCNLQRLDGPVRGNGKIIQELEGTFRGAGWNVIKVIWGDQWDHLLQKDQTGLLAKRMAEVVDGEYQKYVVMPGSYIREHFFGKYPELLELVHHLSDETPQEAQPRRARSGKGIRGLQVGDRNQGPADGDPRQDDQGLRAGRSRRRPQHHASEEEVQRAGAARVPHAVLRFRFPTTTWPRRAVLPAARRFAGDAVSSRAAGGAQRLDSGAPGQRQTAATCSAQARRLSRLHRSLQRQRERYDHGRRAPDARADERQVRSASTSCRSCPTSSERLAWTHCFARWDLRTLRAVVRAGGFATSSRIIARPRTDRFWKKGSPRPGRWPRSLPRAPATRRTACR